MASTVMEEVMEVMGNISSSSSSTPFSLEEESMATPTHPFSRPSTIFAAVAASIFTVVGVAGNVYCTMYIVHCTRLYNVHCTVYTVCK